jgi:hypothetical protein
VQSLLSETGPVRSFTSSRKARNSRLAWR